MNATGDNWDGDGSDDASLEENGVIRTWLLLLTSGRSFLLAAREH